MTFDLPTWRKVRDLESFAMNCWIKATFGPPKVFHQFKEFMPDGIAFDSAGRLLVALCGGGTLAVLSPWGELVESISVGGVNCTNCVFGGSDFQTLYVTEDTQEALLKIRWPVPGQRRFSRSLCKKPQQFTT